MKTITEKINELEYVDLLNSVSEENVEEGRKDPRFMKKVRKAISTLGLQIKVVKNRKGRIAFVDQDGKTIPAISPITSGLAIGAGEAGKSTFYATPYASEKNYGVKSASMEEILNDAKKVKKSIFESSEEEIANLLEGQFDFSGKGQFGPDLETDSFKFIINSCVKAGERAVPTIIWGAPGVGKTSIIRNVLNETYKKKRLITKNLGQCQKDDFTLPSFLKDDSGRNIGVEEIPKTWLPMYKKTGNKEIDMEADNIANGGTKEGEVGEGGIIFFDEIARCGKDVQAVALSLIEDRELVDYRLGSKWCIVAASNREIDDPQMDIQLSKALGNRFQQFNFVPSFDDWYGWAKSQKFIPDDIADFLKFNQNYWYVMNPDDDMEKVFASPRSWANCCKALAVIACGAEDEGFDLDRIPRKMLQLILEANVGQGQATEFLTYYDLTRAVDIDALHNVVKDPKKAPSLVKGKDGKAIRIDVKHYMVSKVLCMLADSTYQDNSMPKVECITNIAKWLAEGKDESLAAAACSILFDMFPKIRYQIGDPQTKNIDGNKDTWDKYVEFVKILIDAMPGMDKDFVIDL